MKTRTAVALVTLAVAVPAFALTPRLFPPSPHMTPTAAQVPFYVVLGGINALALGLGVAFLSFGLPSVRRFVPPGPRPPGRHPLLEDLARLLSADFRADG